VKEGPPPEIRAGTVIGPYEVIERLGVGGMGQVFLARDSRLHRKVALKILTPEANRDEARDAIREARAAARVNHPNVASVHDVLENEQGHTVIVMEYVDGESLASRLARQRLPLDEVVSIGRQVASGLAAAHAEGIIHRDLKPSNVQITPSGVAKILDFGIARATASIVSTRTPDANATLTETNGAGAGAGTPAYMSPEQKLGLKIDERSDLYSLGLVLFEMSAGRRANAGELADLGVAGSNVARSRATELGIQPSLLPIVARATALEPRNRFASAAELERALAAIAPRRSNGQSGLLRRPRAAVVAVVVVVSIAFVVLFRTMSPVHASIRSIAVLPLVNDSHDPQLEYLADGLTDGLINTFGQLGALKVTARTSVMPFKNTKQSVAQIARELDVDAVLEGLLIVEKSASGERIRVSLNLIDPKTQLQIWSETLDRDLGSVLVLQADIARSVADRINLVLTADQRARFGRTPQSVNPQAYKLYLLGREQWNERTIPTLRQALDSFQQAVAVDPTYAPAHAGIADTYALLAGDFGAVPRSDGADAAVASARVALSLDPSLAEAHASMAFANFFLKWNWADADAGFQRAIALNPSYATAHQWFGNFLSDMGRENESLAEMRIARTLDPLSAIISRDVAWPLFFSGRYSEAIQQLQNTLAMHAGYQPAERLLARAEAMSGRTEDAVATFEALVARDDTSRPRYELAWAYAVAGRTPDAERELARAREANPSQEYPYDEALVLTALGRADESLKALDRALKQRDPTLVNLKHDPRLEPLRSDPRYGRLLAAMRFP
jgi:serine/threonine-protein kinase